MTPSRRAVAVGRPPGTFAGRACASWRADSGPLSIVAMRLAQSGRRPLRRSFLGGFVFDLPRVTAWTALIVDEGFAPPHNLLVLVPIRFDDSVGIRPRSYGATSLPPLRALDLPDNRSTVAFGGGWLIAVALLPSVAVKPPLSECKENALGRPNPPLHFALSDVVARPPMRLSGSHQRSVRNVTE